MRIPEAKQLSADALAIRREAISESCIPIGQGALPTDELAKTVSFPWEATWQCDYLVAPDEVAQRRYDLSELVSGSYQVEMRLLFRTFPPYFLRKLEEQGGLDPAVKTRVPIVEMARLQLALKRP